MISDLKYRHWFSVDKTGKIKFDDPEMYETNVLYYRQKKGYICFYDEQEGRPISKESRGYYFKVLIGALQNHKDFYAMSPLDIHHDLMYMFNGTLAQDKDGNWFETYPSMQDMDAKNWREYIEKVEYFVESKGIVLKPENVFQTGRSPNFTDDIEKEEIIL
jgi:hypothetical protein